MFAKFIREITALAWTLGGTGLVLITLSGSTRTLGIYISILSLAVHLAGVLLSREKED
jgi:hypothetical protein